MVDPVARLYVRLTDNEIDANNPEVHQKGDLIDMTLGSKPVHRQFAMNLNVGLINITTGNYATMRPFVDSWQSKLDFTKTSLDTALDKWRVDVSMTNIDSSNRKGLTKFNVDNYLDNWLITTSQFAANTVRFEEKVYDIALSSAVLGSINQNALDQITWSELLYDEQTGLHRIQGDYSATPFTPDQVAKAIVNVELVSHENDIVVFEITRDELFTMFKNDGQDKFNAFLGKNRYRISNSAANFLAGQPARTIDQTKAEVESQLIDRCAL